MLPEPAPPVDDMPAVPVDPLLPLLMLLPLVPLLVPPAALPVLVPAPDVEGLDEPVPMPLLPVPMPPDMPPAEPDEPPVAAVPPAPPPAAPPAPAPAAWANAAPPVPITRQAAIAAFRIVAAIILRLPLSMRRITTEDSAPRLADERRSGRRLGVVNLS